MLLLRRRPGDRPETGLPGTRLLPVLRAADHADLPYFALSLRCPVGTKPCGGRTPVHERSVSHPQRDRLLCIDDRL
jgi:hypothetical protein